MMHLLTKPKVYPLSISPLGWFYWYEGGKEIAGTRITIKLKLKNRGSERTSIEGVFIDQDNRIFTASEPLLLDGHGAVLETIMCFDLPKEKGRPSSGDTLHGLLKLEPWGNRRLLLFGRKYLTARLDISENQTARR